MATLNVHVRTPFWRSWWFYGLLLMAAFWVVIWLDRRRQKRKEMIQEMRSDIAGNLHQEVNTVLSNINILSEVAKMKADYDIEKSKEYIQQIHTRSQYMIVAMNDMLWSIDPSNDDMQKTVDRITEYVEGLNNQNNVAYVMTVDDNTRDVNMNMQVRYHTLHLFKLCLNTLAEAGVRNARIFLGLENNNLAYRIEFERDGIDWAKLQAGFDGKDVSSRLNLIGASLDTDFNKSNSLVLLKVPVV